MNHSTPPNAALQGPIIGVEPDFLRTLPMDNAVGAIVALTAEVYILRERLAALEAQLTARRLLPEDAVEQHQGSAAERQARADDLGAFTQRVLCELSRDRVPVSHIHPDVGRYLKTHAATAGVTTDPVR